MLDLSLCSFAMDRGEILSNTLTNWFKWNVFKNMIIVDWYSRIPIYEFLRETINRLELKNIYIVRALNREIFYITKARNLCMKFMRYEFKDVPKYTLIIDSDVTFVRLLDETMCKEDSVLWDKSQGCLWGTVLMPTKAFWDVNGYYEEITYRHSDGDFMRRLEDKYKIIDNGLSGYLYHMPHAQANPSSRLVRNEKRLFKCESRQWQEKGIMEEIDVEVYYPDGSIRKMKL